MQTEVIQLAVAIIVIALLVLVMRRASQKRRAKGTGDARTRLGRDGFTKPVSLGEPIQELFS